MRFSNRVSCRIKFFSGVVSFCRRAALTLKQVTHKTQTHEFLTDRKVGQNNTQKSGCSCSLLHPENALFYGEVENQFKCAVLWGNVRFGPALSPQVRPLKKRTVRDTNWLIKIRNKKRALHLPWKGLVAFHLRPPVTTDLPTGPYRAKNTESKFSTGSTLATAVAKRYARYSEMLIFQTKRGKKRYGY